jgi:hypothetical protein
MSSAQQIRQSELLAGQDWTVLYRAFTQINFNASDPASINQALQNYIQTNYPEDFNNWIEDDEFVMIIDLLSWLAGTLAFRTDVNARENFLETAISKESVLRLARFLSYNAKRAQSANGLVKITNISTTQTVYDSFGVNLNGVTVNWNDANNPDWLEQFTVILNAAFNQTNPFGIPLSTATLSNIAVQGYTINNQTNANCTYPFTATANGASTQFEIVNLSFDSTGFSEQIPNPTNPFNIAYMNDGMGNSSANTGFFMYFKQGSLQNQAYYLANPIANTTIDIDINNINQTDVWVQSVDTNGNITTNWTQIPVMITDNITYNSVAPSIRTIYQVVTEDNDQIMLRFGDGTFGNVPVGNLQVWFRTCNGLSYQLNPTDISGATIQIPYYDVNGNSQTLTLTFSLQQSVYNAVTSETIESIRRNAPQSFASQSRMVSGEDYNTYPLTSNEIVKMHAVNRIYSGQSRFLDLNDPTSTYQDTVVFSNDGWIYKQPKTQYLNLPVSSNLTPEQLSTVNLQGLLNDISLRDYFIDMWVSQPTCWGMTITPGDVVWNSSTGTVWSASGSLTINNTSTSTTSTTTLYNYLSPGALLKLQWTDYTSGSAVTKYQWVEITESIVTENTVTANASSLPGFVTQLASSSSLTFDMAMQNGAIVVQICPAFRGTLNQTATLIGSTPEMSSIQQYFDSNKPFSLWYQYDTNTLLSSGTVVPGTWAVVDYGAAAPSSTAIHVCDVQYIGSSFWTMEVIIGLQYIFQSMNNVQWYNDATGNIVDYQTGLAVSDTITFMDPRLTGLSFDIVSPVYEADGYYDPTRVVISPTDSNDDGSPDNPECFELVAATNTQNYGWAVFQTDPTTQDSGYFPVDMNVYMAAPQPGQIANDTVFCVITPPTATCMINTENPFDAYGTYAFYEYVSGNNTPQPVTDENYFAFPGASNVDFEWIHYSSLDVRIDPAITNVIDAFVLTSDYDTAVRSWIAAGCDPDTEPTPPTELDLSNTMASLDEYKMFSDQVVWRPVQYRYLFGPLAEPELQAQFKVVPIPNTTMSDGEIQSAIISAINTYFDVNRWEFGETFYYTELAAFIHIQLVTAISSVVIVPTYSTSTFGDLFEVRSDTDELFISTAQVSNIVIINSNTAANLRIS